MNTIQMGVEKSANVKIPMPAQGEGGTPKEILARFIQRQSPWGNEAFIKASCAPIPITLLQSELFGYGRGAPDDPRGAKPIWRGRLCGQADESTRNLVLLDRVF